MIAKEIKNLMEIYEQTGLSVYNNKQGTFLLRLILLYQYYNADETKLEEIEECIIGIDKIDSIIKNYHEDYLIDTYKVIERYDEKFLRNLIDSTNKFYKSFFNGEKNEELNLFRSKIIDIGLLEKINLNHYFVFKNMMSLDEKMKIRELLLKSGSPTEINYIPLFIEDIKEYIQEIDSPNLNVPNGTIKYFGKNNYLIHGNEESIIASVSAMSIKDLYLNFYNNGLFSSNLRYYVKSAKVDDKIKKTIIDEPDNFWYYNNGIIITCRDYVIKSNTIELFDFSIVNGGQTTSLIGNTDFYKDFPIVCKIIKHKFRKKEDNLFFLSKVAETSNTQKPIKTKDLIANRIEQIKLKEQLSEVDVFVQVKRGEKINRQIYKEKWQNAQNDELGQMIFSFIYQHPGIARNSKSKMLENEKYYTKIFKNNYNTFLLLSFQYLKVAYNNWKSHTKKQSVFTEKIGLSNVSFFFMLGILGFLSKTYYNQDFYNYIVDQPSNKNYNEDLSFKNIISQNDIGKVILLKNKEMLVDNQEYGNNFFDFLYEEVLLPSYLKFKETYPSLAYANFTKVDSYYYRSVVPHMVSLIKNRWAKIETFLNNYLIKTTDNIFKLSFEVIDDDDRPGLGEELKNYRTNTYHASQGKIRAYEIFNNMQMSKIVFFKPRTLEDLKNDCNLTNFSVNNFGKEILEIVSRYIEKDE